MTPVWREVLAWARGVSGLRYLSAFTIGMGIILLVPAILYVLFSIATVRTAHPASGNGGFRTALWQAAGRYAYPLIAVALMYHLAHNAGHLLTEAGTLVPVLSDPFGSGRDLFGTAGVVPGPLASQAVIWGIQISLVMIGLLWALRTTESAHRRLAFDWSLSGVPLRSRLVTAGFVLMITIANLWLLAQPMEMRTGM